MKPKPEYHYQMSQCKKFKRDFDGKLSDTMQNSLEEASLIQNELETVNKNMHIKMQSVVEEFNTQKSPLYDRRHALLQSIPHFWAIAFGNHPKLKLLMNSSIEDCFNYLKHIQVVERDTKSFAIIFEFEENPYFYNSKLVKELTYEEQTYNMKKIVVDWKENMNLCSKLVKKEERKHVLLMENFFDWLLQSSNDDIICDIIRDDLWVDPLKYFLCGNENSTASESDSEEQDCDDFLDTKETSSEGNSSLSDNEESKTT